MSADTVPPPAASLTPPERSPFWRRNRVPVEHRFLGMDKRSFPWAFAVLGVWLLWAVVVPRVNDAVSFEDEVRAGERFAVTEDLVFTPTAGWNVLSGFRSDERGATGGAETVALSSGGLTLVISTDEFSGTPDELLDQVDRVTTATGAGESFHTTDPRQTVTTASGLVGVAEGFTSPRVQGVAVAFVDDGTGIEVQVVGPVAQISARSDELVGIIESIGPRSSDDGGDAS